MSQVELIKIKKSFAGTEIMRELNLVIPKGSFTVLVGPSGCGKSTLLRIISGLEQPTSGEVLIGGQNVTTVEPSDRGISMVFQSYALFPHMTVARNIDFGLRLAKVPAEERNRRVQDAAEILHLTHLLDRKPAELSGGQRQRVAIGRSIVRQPNVFLFDEPLSNLDAALRNQMRVELAELHSNLESTMIYVTHDQIEAMTLADQIVVMNSGAIEQVGTPNELYEQPQTEFVATFIGTPKMNLLKGDIATSHSAATYGIRPEHLMLEEGGAWRAKVTFVEYLGNENIIHLDSEVGFLITRATGPQKVKVGEVVRVSPMQEHIHLFDTHGKRI